MNLFIGIEYTLGRVPIASTDFSTHEYSYDEIPDDFDMRHFALVSEDLHYKVGEHVTRDRSRNEVMITILLYMYMNDVLCSRGEFQNKTKQTLLRHPVEYSKANVSWCVHHLSIPHE